MQSTLTVDNAPAKSLAYSNRVYLHPSDFAAFKSASPAQGVADDCCLLLLSGAGGDWVFAASAYPTMAAGKLGVASMQRRTAGLEIDAAVDVAPFTATLDTGLGKLRLSLAPFKAGASVDLDAAEVGAYFMREYGCQVFAVGQKLAVAFKKNALIATVEGLDFGVGDLESGGRFGQVLPGVTQGLPFKERDDENPNFKLSNVADEVAAVDWYERTLKRATVSGIDSGGSLKVWFIVRVFFLLLPIGKPLSDDFVLGMCFAFALLVNDIDNVRILM